MTNFYRLWHWWLGLKGKDRANIIGIGVVAAYTTFAAFQWCAMKKANRINRIAAQAAKESADVANQTMQVDQRPWMNVTVGQGMLQDGWPIKMPIHIVNSGKTPAYKLKGDVVVNLLNAKDQPDFDYRPGVHPKYDFDSGVAIPNFPSDELWAVLPKHVP